MSSKTSLKKHLFPTRIALALIIPSLILYLFFSIWPMIFSIGLAFTNANRDNIAPSPEKIADIQRAIACANYLKNSTEYRGSAKQVADEVLQIVVPVKETLYAIQSLVTEANDTKELGSDMMTYVGRYLTQTRKLPRIRPAVASIFNCTAIGYQTTAELLPRSVLDSIDTLINLGGVLSNYNAYSITMLREYVAIGINATQTIEYVFTRIEQDYDGYMNSVINTLENRLDSLQLKFVGLDNFIKLFTDPRFYYSLFKTLAFVAVSVPMKVGLGVALALLFSSPMIYGRKVFRALLLVPWALPFLLSALTWKFMSIPGKGILSILLGLNINVNEWHAFIVYSLFETWLAYPFIMTVTQGALAGVSKDVIEAAYIDGANAWQRATKVILPLISRPLILATILTTGASLQAFMIPLVLNGGGPTGTINIPFIGSAVGNLNEMLILFGYNRMYIDNLYGYAASIYLVVVIIILVYVGLWYALSRKYGGGW
jgi:arabinogalactan oligomer/maltooligosaccharide transport system permease protein